MVRKLQIDLQPDNFGFHKDLIENTLLSVPQRLNLRTDCTIELLVSVYKLQKCK